MDGEIKAFKIPPEEKVNQKKKNIVYHFIITILALIILLLESLYILLSAFKKGFLKKEVLTTKSNIGFDIIIKSN